MFPIQNLGRGSQKTVTKIDNIIVICKKKKNEKIGKEQNIKDLNK